MQKQNIAILLTCHNRKDKTIACLTSLYQAVVPMEYQLDVFLTDDGSSDGTDIAVNEKFSQVRVIKGDGSLFWAGGMRLAWKTAIDVKPYDSYLLINDDVVLRKDFFKNLLETDAYSVANTGKHGIYSGATIDEGIGEVTYGGSIIKKNHFLLSTEKLTPASCPQHCDFVNANILWVCGSVVEKIGIFENRYTHGIADYDYSRQAVRNNIPVWLAPGVCGVCNYDHGKNWKSSNMPLKERITWMKSPKGLAYDEYLYYIKKHFPLYLPYSFVMLWMKIFFPFIWDKLK